MTPLLVPPALFVSSCPFDLSGSKERILLEITTRCNQQCKHCFAPSDLRRDIDITLLSAVFSDIADDPAVEQVWLSGGEPLLHPQVVDICRLVSKAGKSPSISTNGDLLTTALAKELSRAGVAFFHISLDGPNSFIHDGIRSSPGAHGRVVSAVKLLLALNVRVAASCVLTSANLSVIKETASFADDIGISELTFYPPSKGGNVSFADVEKIQAALVTSDARDALVAADHMTSHCTVDAVRMPFESVKSLDLCQGERFFTICADGTLGPCPWYVNSDRDRSRVCLKTYSWQMAKRSVAESFREAKRDHRQSRTLCANCKHLFSCGGGCPAQGDIDPLCIARRLSRES